MRKEAVKLKDFWLDDCCVTACTFTQVTIAPFQSFHSHSHIAINPSLGPLLQHSSLLSTAREPPIPDTLLPFSSQVDPGQDAAGGAGRQSCPICHQHNEKGSKRPRAPEDATGSTSAWTPGSKPLDFRNKQVQPFDLSVLLPRKAWKNPETSSPCPSSISGDRVSPRNFTREAKSALIIICLVFVSEAIHLRKP
ncbi:PREDICTED: uncharacterized protein LOC105547634 [Mandrillus leucophaeus]|uniref:uncharacterized protein LOC105547634 n=1 Tax=Mandrillus leucophaeus TaxID=9568 RepID=UPI0005F41B07|nr:PREDICTED: uncharacterized protein LOC105547634 [Mandrillus leucophaeus]